ncbi:membrane-bound lytic murein transglycosylase D [Pedobacter sp. UYP30]|uniref:lytic transglycosylase domain-containing protein n=1 Tax=Pedobacter sp. UYP30 TaxID=1756400 RepID=UPI003398EB20
MIKLMRIFYLLPLLSLTTSAFSQQKINPDSLLKTSNFFVDTDSRTVPEAIENQLLFGQNYIYKLRLDSIQKTVPLPYNEYVQQYIDIYSKRKDMFGKMLGLSNYYFPIFEKALAEYNVPKEIEYLTIIESEMNPNARSRVGATGLWQFMFGTGKAYGLQMDNYVDERKDPIQASYAAAAYFRDSYEELGDWLLALAAYNCGKGNVNRAIAKAGSRDFWEIRQFLPKETRNYVPAFIAAVYVMNYSSKHQITPQACNLCLKTDTVLVNKFVSLPQLANALNVSSDALADLNPSYKKQIVNGTDETPKRIILPSLQNADFTGIYNVLNTDYIDANPNIILASTDDVRALRKASASNLSREKTVLYKVRPGQSLNAIADKYNVEVQDLKVWNRLKSNVIVPGQHLKIYVHGAPAKAATSSYSNYRVKAGDTLSDIAERFDGVTVQRIKNDNGLKKSILQPGMLLKISKG